MPRMTSPPSPQPPCPLSRTKIAASMIIIGGLFVALAYSGVLSRLQGVLKEAVVWIAQLGAWAPVLYIALYVVACLVLIPASVLTLRAAPRLASSGGRSTC